MPTPEPVPNLDQFLADHWDEIAARATARATQTIVWNQRIETANWFLVAAAILICIQSVIGMLTLANLVS